MESLMKPVTENGDTSATRSSRRSVDVSPSLDSVLDEIRAGADNALYGARPDVSEELFAKHVASLVEGAGLPVLQTMHYRWFLHELARLWRTRQGRDLAFHVELCIRKWVGLGLEPRTLQFLVCEAHQRLKGREPFTVNREPSTASDSGPAIDTRQSSIENGETQRHEGGGETRALDCGSELSDRGSGPTPAFPDRADGPERAAASLPHSTELRSMSQTPSAESASSVDVQARISHPPIAPIGEDSSSSVRNPNLPESVESVDDSPAPSSAESAKSVDDRSRS